MAAMIVYNEINRFHTAFSPFLLSDTSLWTAKTVSLPFQKGKLLSCPQLEI